MKVICNKHQGCPVERCPHREPHSTIYELAQMAYKPIEIETYCDDTERICGEREPRERITVICQPVEGENVPTGATAKREEPIPA